MRARAVAYRLSAAGKTPNALALFDEITRRFPASANAWDSLGETLQASQMIAAGTPLAEVAIDCGFFDQSHMTHVFKSVTGFAPVQLRKLVS